MSLKLLITESESPLGEALVHDIEREPFNALLPKAKDIDWSQASQVMDFLRQKHPDAVINNYAWTQLGSEEGRKRFQSAATNIATACGALNIPLVQLSSYQVFSGDSKGTHSEKDVPHPTDPIGQTLHTVEQLIVQIAPRSIILRFSWLIGAYGDNLLTRLLGGYLDGRAVTANRLLRGAPTSMADAVRVTLALVKQISCGADNWGVLHYCSNDVCSQEEFAEQLLQLLIQQQLLTAEPSLTIVDEEPEGEPHSATLTCRNIRDNFGVQPRSWRPSLLPLVKQWLHNRG